MLLLTVAHEGSHAQDHSDYQDALIAAGETNDEAKIMAVVNGPLRVTKGVSETRAYGVSSALAEFTYVGKAEQLFERLDGPVWA